MARVGVVGLAALASVLASLLAAPAATAKIRTTVVLVAFANDSPLATAPDTTRQPVCNDTLHTGLESFLQSRNISFHTRIKFTNTRLPLGMSVALGNGDDVQALYAYPPVTQALVTQTGPTNALVRHTPRSHTPSLEQRQLSTSSDADILASMPDTWGPHKMVGADRLHAEHSYGHGINIGVVDTGLDHTHPAFGNCYGKPGCRVVGGAAFVSDANAITITQGPSDPRPDCNSRGIESGWGHGTHVAGVIGAIDTARNFTGMAPLAQLSAYRITGCTGISAPDVALAAIERAYYDGMDVISMSFSFGSGWQQAFASTFVSRITDLGVPVLLSQGNSGESGLFTPQSPTVARGAASIGSAQNTEFPGWTMRILRPSSSKGSGACPTGLTSYISTNPYAFPKNASASAKQLPVYATSKKVNDPNDACDDLPDSTPNLAKYMTLIRVSKNCRPDAQLQNAIAKGAKYLMLYNAPNAEPIYADELIDPDLASSSSADGIPAAQASIISNEDGVAIVKMLAAGKKVVVDLAEPRGTVVNNTATGGLVGAYSDYGPGWDGAGWPGLVGVGGQVLSTWPVNAGSYAVLQGTSFSTPMIAGAYALYKSIKGQKETPQELNAIFTTTARPLASNKTAGGVLESVAHQGGGLLDVYKAVKSTTRVWPYQLLLNDSHAFAGTQTLTVRNVGDKTQVFTIQHMPAGTLYGQDGTERMTYLPGPLQPYAKDQASVQFSTTQLSIAPGQTGSVTLTFTPPKIATNKLGVYSGYIRLVSDQGDLGSLTVPYLGIAVDFATAPLLDVGTVPDDGPQTFLRDPRSDTQGGLTSDNETFNLANFDEQPSMRWTLHYASPLAVTLLVRANTSFEPTWRETASGLVRSNASSATSGSGTGCKKLDPADLIAPLHLHPLLDRGVSDYDFISGTYTDPFTGQRGTKVPDGVKARVLFRALKPGAALVSALAPGPGSAGGGVDKWLRGEICGGEEESYLSMAFNVQNR